MYGYVDVLGVAFETRAMDTKLPELLSGVKGRWEVFHGNLSDGLAQRELAPSVNELCAAYGALVDWISASSLTDQQGRSHLVRSGVDLANAILARLANANLYPARERLVARVHAFAESEISKKPRGYIDSIFLNLKFFHWLEKNGLLSEHTDRWDYPIDRENLEYQIPDDVMENFARDVRTISQLQDDSRYAYGSGYQGRYIVRHPLKDPTAADYFWTFVRAPKPFKDVSDTGSLTCKAS